MTQPEKIFNNLEEVISNYLDEANLSEIFKDLAVKLENEKTLSESVKSEVEKTSIEDPRFIQLRKFQIEVLLTNLENKLDEAKYYDLLLTLGRTVTNLGEYRYAHEFFELLIIKVTAKDKYIDFLAHAYLGISALHTWQASWTESIKYVQLAMSILSKEKEYVGMARCENQLGVIFGEQGEFALAEEHFNNALEFLYLRGDKYLNGKVENNLGILNLVQQNYDTALTRFQRALSVFEQFDDYDKIAEIKYNVGVMLAKKAKYNEALNELDKSISAAVKAEKISHLGKSYLCKAGMLSDLSEYNLAIAYADRAMEISLRLNDRLSIADIYKIKGIVHRNLKNNELSENYLLTSLRLNKELNNKNNYAETSLELGILYRDWENVKKSQIYLNNALEYNKKIGAWRNVETIESILSELKSNNNIN